MEGKPEKKLLAALYAASLDILKVIKSVIEMK